jgi:hypothetical protein
MLKMEGVVDKGLSKDSDMEKTMKQVNAVLEKQQHWAG